MEGLNLHLPSVLSESYYDMPGHGSGFTSYPTTSWLSRDDCGGRNASYPQPQGTNVTDDGTVPYDDVRSRLAPSLAESDGQCDETRHEEPTVDAHDADWCGDEAGAGEKESEKGSPRQSQVALTLHWLSDNYERAEGVCLPRCVLYQHYLDFCKKMKFTPAGAATFGKIIRQRFPKLTTRRLGTRGQSKYHYYGIGIKESSIYYHSVYSGKGLTRFSGIKLKTEGSSRKYSLSSKTGTLLPEFPNANNLILPPGTELEKLRTFIMMYRTHCQRILDTVISANFEEVQNFLVHFWQGMPEHLIPLLTCDLLPDIISLCDSILYKVLLDVLIPSTIQELPHSLYTEMRLFTKHLPSWIKTSMETVPGTILDTKLEVAKSFIQSLRRQSSFVHLAQTARSVTTNQETVSVMVRDISAADFLSICSQAGYLDPADNPKFAVKMQTFYSEFKDLLTKQSPIEGYTEWMDEIVEKLVLLPSGEDTCLFREKAADFLLHWGAFTSLLMRELTLQNAPSFASVHVVQLMLDEYAFLVIETQQDADLDKRRQVALQKHMKNAEEIQTKAVVRAASHKNINSPKCKKKRNLDDIEESPSVHMETNHSGVGQTVNDVSSATAFSRPFSASSKEQEVGGHAAYSDMTSLPRPLTGAGSASITVPQVKPYQPYNGTFERPTYLPQFGIGSYPDYVTHNPSFGNARGFSNYSETYSQTFPSNPFTPSLPSMAGNYWTDGRSSHSLSDPYQHYNYNKFNAATYDSINKTTLLRNNAYQDPINRQPLDSSRTYYRGPHDNLQVAPSLQMGSYGANFMDIAPSGSQYCYQDDLFAGSMAASFAKPFLSGHFR